MKKRRFKTAFILGAGLGNRLRPLTERCPKPLLPLGRQPIITYAMDHLIGVGIERFIVNTHHCHEVYDQKFPARQWRGIPIIFCYEPVLLDTGGGLKNIEELLVEDEVILCYNGDVFSTLPLQRLIEAHERMRPEVTLALRSSGGLLNVNISHDGRIVDLRHTFGISGVQACLFTGIYTVETSFLQFADSGKPESIVAVLLRQIRENGESIRGVVIDEGDWSDIGSLDTYKKLRNTMEGL